MKITPKEMILSYIENKIAEYESGIKEAQLQLGCLKATKQVYALHGEQHPSTYGQGPKEEDIINYSNSLVQCLGTWRNNLIWFNTITGDDTPNAQIKYPPGLDPNDAFVTTVQNRRTQD